MDFTEWQRQIMDLRKQCSYSDDDCELRAKWEEEEREYRTAIFLQFSKRDVLFEAGDILTVVTAQLAARGLTLADAAQAAVDKLTARANDG